MNLGSIAPTSSGSLHCTKPCVRVRVGVRVRVRVRVRVKG